MAKLFYGTDTNGNKATGAPDVGVVCWYLRPGKHPEMLVPQDWT